MLKIHEMPLVTLAAALALLTSCTRDKTAFRPSRPTPVAWAFSLLEQHAPQDDLDARDFGTAWLEVVRASLACDAPDAAADAAERITTWQRGVAHAEMAAAAARRADHKAAAHQLDQARAWRETIRLRHATDTMGWTVERISAAIVLAEQEGSASGATNAPAALADPDLDPATITRLVAAQPYESVSNCLHAVTRQAAAAPKALLVNYAEGALDWTLTLPALDPPDYTLVTNWITATLPIHHLSQQVSLLARLAAVAVRSEADPEPWLAQAAATARLLPDGYLRAEALARTARTLHPFTPGEAGALFAEAETAAQAAQWEGDRALAFCRLAERLAAVGDTAGADRCFSEAARLALQLTNPSPRLRHASAVACAIAASRHTPSPDLADRFNTALCER